MTVYPTCLTSQEFLAKTGPGRLFRLNLATYGIGFLFTAPEIIVHFRTVTMIISEYGKHISQRDDVGVAIGDGFRRHSLVVVIQYNLQCKAGIADANDAIFVHAERHRIGMNEH